MYVRNDIIASPQIKIIKVLVIAFKNIYIVSGQSCVPIPTVAEVGVGWGTGWGYPESDREGKEEGGLSKAYSIKWIKDCLDNYLNTDINATSHLGMRWSNKQERRGSDGVLLLRIYRQRFPFHPSVPDRQ